MVKLTKEQVLKRIQNRLRYIRDEIIESENFAKENISDLIDEIQKEIESDVK